MSVLPVLQSNPITTVQNGRAYLDNLANKFIVKPKNAKGIFGFVFDYEGDSTLQYNVQITDHYAEDNSVINDHIAIQPLRMVLRGFISELVLKAPSGILGSLGSIQNKLTTVPAYLGDYTPGALAKIQKAITKTTNVVNTIDQSIARVKNVVGLFKKATPAITKQEKAFLELQSLMFSKFPMLVETPYGVFNNMVIEGITFIQDENTKSWSDISVSLKQMNFVKTATANPDKNANRFMQQSQSITDKGKTQGKSIAASVVDAIKGSSLFTR